MLKSIYCVGKIENTGGINITEKGFVYSDTVEYPIINLSGCTKVIVTSQPSPSGEFSTTIGGLPENTRFFIRSFATNLIGTDYSDNVSSIITTGSGVLPTMIIKSINKLTDIEQTIYEVGTVNQLVVSGITTQNDETIFTNLSISQNSIPPVSNPIRSWSNVLKRTFRTDESPSSVLVNFTPFGDNSESLTITHSSVYVCGQNPTYNISATTHADAIFPYLWEIVSTYAVSPSYYNPGVTNTTNYLYYHASTYVSPDAKKIQNGKIVENQGEKMILMTPSGLTNKLVLGYPKEYGEVIKFKIGDSGTWIQVGTVTNTDVGTGYYGGNFGIVNSWIHNYYFMRYTFSIPPNETIKFYIKHTP